MVFAVAALDAYLHDLVLEEVSEGRADYDHLTDALKVISKDDPGLSLRVALAGSKAERQSEFRKALERWLAAKSFQGPEAVARSLSYLGKFSEVMSLDHSVTPTWRSDLEQWTQMRHGLVHRAESPYVRRADAGRCLDLVEQIVVAIDHLVLDRTKRF